MLSLRNLELLKWFGLFFMLADHINVYVLGNAFPYAEIYGSLAFPLFSFALAFAIGRADENQLERVFWRLVFWAVVAQLFCLFVRETLPLNIIFTFASAVAIFRWWDTPNRTPVLLLALAAGLYVEFSLVGVALVTASLFAVRSPSLSKYLCVLALLLFLYPFNMGNHAAILAVPVALMLSAFPSDLPRMRGLFYRIYALQWPVFLVLGFLVHWLSVAGPVDDSLSPAIY